MGLPVVIADPKTLKTIAFGIALSLGLHALVAFVMESYLALPSLGIEFVEPTEIEFGIADGTTLETEAEATPPPPLEPPPTAPQEAQEGQESAAADAGPRSRRDAAVADAGVPDDAGADGGPEVRDAGARSPSVARATEGRDSRMPSGANVALRFDFEHIRGTPLARPIGELLTTIQDFQAVISASGLDPVEDLDQFVMTSRNPWRRVLYMYVGRLRHDEAWARERVRALAAAKGLPAEWSTVDGIEMAPWHDDDEVDRVLALLGDRYFLLAPASEIPLLRGWIASFTDGSGAGSALGVADGEVVSLEAENVPRYLREEDRPNAPRSARVSILADGSNYDVAIRADFVDPEIASASEQLLGDRLSELGNNRAVRLFGLGDMLQSIELRVDERRLRGHSVLATSDVQLLLATAQSMLRSHYENASNSNERPPAP